MAGIKVKAIQSWLIVMLVLTALVPSWNNILVLFLFAGYVVFKIESKENKQIFKQLEKLKQGDPVSFRESLPWWWK